MRIFGDIERERVIRPAHRMADGDLRGDDEGAADQQEAGGSAGLDQIGDEGGACGARRGRERGIRADEVGERQIQRAAQQSDEARAGNRLADRQRERAPEDEAARRLVGRSLLGRQGEDEKGRAAQRQRLRGEDPAARHDIEIAPNFQEELHGATDPPGRGSLHA